MSFITFLPFSGDGGQLDSKTLNLPQELASHFLLRRFGFRHPLVMSSRLGHFKYLRASNSSFLGLKK